MTNETRPPDAIRSPLGHAGGGSARDRLARLHREFSVVLQADRLHVRNQGSYHFITRRPDDTLMRCREPACAGTPRYEWVDRGDGVFLGYRTGPLP